MRGELPSKQTEYARIIQILLLVVGMSRFLILVLFSAMTLVACAQSSAPSSAKATNHDSTQIHQRVERLLRAIDANAKPDYIGDAPFPGFQEVVVGGQVLYVSNDGQYILQGQPYNVRTKQVAVSAGLLAFRRELLQTTAKADRIIFAAAHPKYTVTIFTDVECGYCRKLHSDIAKYNELGISVEYVAFPRMGLGSDNYREMVAIWCAKDRQKALTDAKSGHPVAQADCANPVASEYTLGLRLGVNGTPAIFSADGNLLGGYLPPEKLLAALAPHQPASPESTASANAPGG